MLSDKKKDKKNRNTIESHMHVKVSEINLRWL